MLVKRQSFGIFTAEEFAKMKDMTPAERDRFTRDKKKKIEENRKRK